MNQIIPAILTDDKSELSDKLGQVFGLASWAQVDIMDGKFVDSTSINLSDLNDVKQKPNLSIHLMVENPEDYFEQCKEVGAKRVVFHAKTSTDYQGLLKQLDSLGLKKGIALDPDDDISLVVPIKNSLDVILVMGVYPGRGGQEFLPSCLAKVAELQKEAPDVEIIVDGGVSFDNIEDLKKVGADSFVIGSTIFDSDDIAKTIKELQEIIK